MLDHEGKPQPEQTQDTRARSHQADQNMDASQVRDRNQKEGELLRERGEPTSTMNLLTHFEETVKAIAKMESSTESPDPYFLHVLVPKEERQSGDTGIEEALQEVKSIPEEKRLLDGRPYTVTTIYGGGGGYRYVVFSDGEVRFSAFHAGFGRDTGALVKADRLGFRFFN